VPKSVDLSKYIGKAVIHGFGDRQDLPPLCFLSMKSIRLESILYPYYKYYFRNANRVGIKISIIIFKGFKGLTLKSFYNKD
jgi:hypothetical protein